MPTEDGLPCVHDVITSPKFSFANWSENGKFLKIVNVEESSKYYIALERNGSFAEKTLSRDARLIDSFDASRAHAEFVIEDSRWADNPVTKGTHACASRWYVSARRLKSNGSYDPLGERIAFFLCGLPDENVLAMHDIKIVRTMNTPNTPKGKRKKT